MLFQILFKSPHFKTTFNMKLKAFIKILYSILKIFSRSRKVKRGAVGSQMIIFTENINIHIKMELVISYFNGVFPTFVFHSYPFI